MFNYTNLKKILFLFDPETAHDITAFALQKLHYFRLINNKMVEKNFITDPRLRQDFFDVTFYNPVGLAAGFDKNATMIDAMPALGFGFTEIGTMTPKAQSGNDKPRMFRHEEEKSIQNAMGFNNKGSYDVAKNLRKMYPFSIPIGANVGKNKNTTEEFALSDYKMLIKKFKDISDYLVINISSPNTPNLRDLQNEEFITKLFEMATKITSKPILLKIAPDMEIKTAITLCQTAIKAGASGIIATNTSIDYSLVNNAKDFGGLSGDCIREKSYEFFKELTKELYGKTILISAGGISDANEAYRRLKAGASLIQAYSGMVFKGPSMVRKINEGLLELLEEDGFTHLSQAIGSDLK